MYINTMTKNIEQYLDSKQSKIYKLKLLPIIISWMNSPTMKDSLDIIDKHVEYLLNNQGANKVEQWFLAGDVNFNSITAERYIIGYLLQRNKNLKDNLAKDGIDAHIGNGNSAVGIEITTLNSDVGSWILVERLKQFLIDKGFLKDKSLEITYSQQRVSEVTKGGTINNFINEMGLAIISNDNQMMNRLGFSIKFDAHPGWISWNLNDSDSLPWFRIITDDLLTKLAKEKAKQLKKFSRNLVFVGLNHSAPSDGIFPRIFKDLGNDETHFLSEIQGIREYWTSQMPSLANVIGICYFFYSLERENPFYPLKIFWRSEEDKVNINL